MAGRITVVSAERIAEEMRRMLVDRSRATAVDLLRDVRLLGPILPELAMANEPGALTAVGQPADRAWLAGLETLGALIEPSFPLALAALVHPFVDGQGAWRLCRRWKLSNRETGHTRWLVEQQDALRGARAMSWSRLQPLLVSEGIKDLLALHDALALSCGGDPADAVFCRERLRLPADELDPPPLVTGDDLLADGVPRGREYQRCCARCGRHNWTARSPRPARPWNW